MRIVNIHEAKTQLSKLIELVLQGEEIIIAKSGNPIVQLKPYEKPKERKLGLMKGKIIIADDFDEIDEEIIRMFEGEDE